VEDHVVSYTGMMMPFFLLLFLMSAMHCSPLHLRSQKHFINYATKMAKLPYTFAVGSDYTSEPSRQAMYRLTSDLAEGLAACSCRFQNPMLYGLIGVLNVMLQIRNATVVHEVAGHGVIGSRLNKNAPYYQWSHNPKAKKRLFWSLLTAPTFKMGAATYQELTDEQLRNFQPYRSFLEGRTSLEGREIFPIEDNQKGRDRLHLIELDARQSYAGMNAEVELSRYMSKRVLQGEVVRSETIFLYLRRLAQSQYSGPDVKQLGNDHTVVDAYYRHLLDSPNAVRSARNKGYLVTFLSGTFASYARALFLGDVVKPFWLFDRVLWPDFSIFYTRKGPSVLIESALRITDQAYISFGCEYVFCPGKDYFTKEKLSAQEWRFGFCANVSKSLKVAAYSLIQGYGGMVEAVWEKPEKYFGVSIGWGWSSDKTLCGERMQERDLPGKEKSHFGYFRYHFIV